MNLKEKLLSLGCFEDNEYLDFYCKLVEQNHTTKKEKHKTQLHHIIEKCYYKKHNLKVDNSKENLVYLLYKDHVIAHYYLALCSKDKYYKFANISAIKGLLGRRYKEYPDIKEEFLAFTRNSTEYQKIYEEGTTYLYDKYKRNIEVSAETRLKISIAGKGKKRSREAILRQVATRKKNGNNKLSPEARLKKSISMKEFCKKNPNFQKAKVTDITRMKLRESRLNYLKDKKFIWITNGFEEKRIDLNTEIILDGWKRGRIYKKRRKRK